MIKKFDWDGRLGSNFDRASNIEGTATNVRYFARERGHAFYSRKNSTLLGFPFTLDLGTGSFSVEIGFKLINPGASLNIILSQFAGTNGIRIVYNNTTGTIDLTIGDGVSQVTLPTLPSSISQQKLYHYVGIIDRSTNIMSCYLDGAYQNQVSIAGITGQIKGTSNMFIGGDVSPSATAFNGDLYFVKVYEGVFNIGDISKLFKNWEVSFPFLEANRPFYEAPRPVDLGNLTNEILGGELLINGNFDTPSDWTLGAGCAISGGSLNIDIGIPVTSYQVDVPMEIGNNYRAYVKISSYTSGELSIQLGSSGATALIPSSIGEYYFNLSFTAPNKTFYFNTGVSGYTGSVDTVRLEPYKGLIVAYNMKPVNGQILDISGNGHHGNIYRAIGENGGLKFNGKDSQVNLTTDTPLNPQSTICIRAYIGKTQKAIANLISTNTSSAGTHISINGATGKAYWYPGSGGWIEGETDLRGKEVTLNFVFDKGNYKIYVDSILEKEFTGGLYTLLDIGILGNLLISGRELNGTMKDLRLYNRILSLKEIRAYHDSFANRIDIKDNFIDEPTGTKSFKNWQVGSGSFKLGETIITESEIIYPVPNSGATGTTDWVDTNTDGLADDWSETSPGSYTFSIVTGSGFNGNAQRMAKLVTSGIRRVQQNITVTPGMQYYVSATYRASLTGTANITFYDAPTIVAGLTFSTNTGNATTIKSTLPVSFTNSTVTVWMNVYNNSDWLEVDEVYLYELKYDPVTYPPEIDLSSFKKSFNYIECTAQGKVSNLSKQAYGIWEFDIYRGSTSVRPLVQFIALEKKEYNDLSQVSYVCFIANTGKFYFRRYNNGSITPLFNTTAGYIQDDMWYRIKITRSLGGKFHIYIKGGGFGLSYILISSLESGQNPVIDNNITGSNYFVAELDPGDKLAFFKTKGLDSYEQNNVLSAYFPLTL